MRVAPRPSGRAAIAVVACLVASAVAAGAGRGSAAPGRWTTAGLEGGFVEAVAVNPSRPATVMAGTRQGVFVSHDAGATWAASSVGLTQLSVRHVTFDRDRPDAAYAATTGGLFATSNGGLLWTPLIPRQDVLEVQVVYDDPRRLIENQTWALKGSDDGGLTWETLYEQRNHQLMDFAVAPSDPDVVYLVVVAHADDTRSEIVQRSDDGGHTWTRVSEGVWPSSLVVDAYDPMLVTAVREGSIVRSDDGGRTWDPVFPGADGRPSMLVAAPSDPRTLYALGAYPDVGMFVSKSEDGGASWTHVGDVAESRYPTEPAVSPDDPRTLYLGTFGNGLLKSTDGGATFRYSNRGLAAAPARDIALDPRNPARAYAVTAFRGVFRSDDGGATWSDVMSGFADGGHPRASVGVAAVAVDSASVVYATRYLQEGPAELAVFRSEDGGDSWTAGGAPASGAHVLLPHPQRAGELLAGSGRGVHRSTDRGMTWTPAGPVDERIEALASGGGDTVYAATGDDHFGNEDASRLYVSHDFGATWERLGYPPVRHVTSLAVRRNPAVLYAGSGVSSEVGISVDGGATWTLHPVDFTNAAGNVTAIAPDPLDPTQVLAGTHWGGLWISRTAGTTWLPVTPGIYGQEVYDVVFTPLPVDLPVDIPLLRSRPALAGVTSTRRAGVSRIVLAPHAFRRPSVDGEPGTGESLTCARGRWSRARSFSYVWTRDGAVLDTTGPEYRVRPGDAGSTISCTVAARGPGGRGRAAARGVVVR